MARHLEHRKRYDDNLCLRLHNFLLFVRITYFTLIFEKRCRMPVRIPPDALNNGAKQGLILRGNDISIMKNFVIPCKHRGQFFKKNQQRLKPYDEQWFRLLFNKIVNIGRVDNFGEMLIV